MGMLLHRRFVAAAAKPVKSVQQTEPEVTVEMPKVEYEQTVVTEVVEEPEKEPKTKTVRHTTKTTSTRKAGRPAKRK